MFKFFVDKKMGKEHFFISEAIWKHMKVARILDKKFICNYQNQFYLCQINNRKAQILQKLEQNNEFNAPVVFAVALIEWKRFEWMIQKLAELGATKLIPIVTIRTQKNLLKVFVRKKERFEKIIINACQQAFRNNLLEITNPIQFNEVLKLQYANKYIAHQSMSSKPIMQFKPNSLFLIGPEGGFVDQEIELAKSNNFEVVLLAKTILKTETAVQTILSRVEF